MQLRYLSLLLLFVSSTLLLSSCGEDDDPDTSTKGNYTMGSYTGSMANANIYLAEENVEDWGATGQFNTRTYIITDGEYTTDFLNGEYYWNLSTYTNSTYVIGVMLYAKDPLAVTTGDYGAVGDFMGPEHFAYMNAWFAPNFTSERFQSDGTATASFKISGKLEPENKITIGLSGKLMVWKNGGAGWGRFELQDASMKVEGMIKDIRQ